jgi:Lipopolysaccharide-assembly
MTYAFRVRPLLLVVMLVLATPLMSSCGYSLAGRGSSLPTTVRSIGIPLFENATPVFELEQLMTEKVRLEFISRGKYRVMPDAPGADAVLIGGITSVTITPTSFNSNQQATRYAFSMVVKVEFRDAATNRILYENPSLSFREEYEVAGNVAGLSLNAPDANAFLGSNSEAKERMANDFARSVVSSILEAF